MLEDFSQSLLSSFIPFQSKADPKRNSHDIFDRWRWSSATMRWRLSRLEAVRNRWRDASGFHHILALSPTLCPVLLPNCWSCWSTATPNVPPEVEATPGVPSVPALHNTPSASGHAHLPDFPVSSHLFFCILCQKGWLVVFIWSSSLPFGLLIFSQICVWSSNSRLFLSWYS